MSAAVQLAKSTEETVHREARVHLRAVLSDALAALCALDHGDYAAADSSLKGAMIAAGDCRSALSVALVPPSPKAQVDAGLKEWFT